MREKYESLSLAVLKDLAKARGMKGISAMKKSEVIEAMLSQDEKEGIKESTKETAKEVSGEPHGSGMRSMESRSQETNREIRSTENRGQETNREARSTENRSQETNRETRSAEMRGYRTRNTENRNQETNRETRSYGARSTENRSQETNRETRNTESQSPENAQERTDRPPTELSQLDSGIEASGILEVMPDGFGFIRSDNYLPGENDVYVSPSQIRRFNLKTGDIISGNTRIKAQQEKFGALLYLKTINGKTPSEAMKRYNFEDIGFTVGFGVAVAEGFAVALLPEDGLLTVLLPELGFVVADGFAVALLSLIHI